MSIKFWKFFKCNFSFWKYIVLCIYLCKTSATYICQVKSLLKISRKRYIGYKHISRLYIFWAIDKSIPIKNLIYLYYVLVHLFVQKEIIFAFSLQTFSISIFFFVSLRMSESVKMFLLLCKINMYHDVIWAKLLFK